MKALVEDRFDDIRAIITNSGEGIDLDLMDENRKKTYRETVGRDDDAEGDLNDDVIDKSIYIFSQIKYTKTKTYRKYIYICQWHNSKQCCESHLIIYTLYIFIL